jgi:hypothetical protein
MVVRDIFSPTPPKNTAIGLADAQSRLSMIGIAA